jgi:chromosome segregation ATPase
LTKLKNEIDEVTAALTRSENKGFCRESEKLKTRLAGLKKEYEELGAKVSAANNPLVELSPIMVTAEQRTIKLAAANVSLAKSCDTVAASVDDLSPIIEELVEVADRRHPTSVRPLGGTRLGNAIRAAFSNSATPVGWRPDR